MKKYKVKYVATSPIIDNIARKAVAKSEMPLRVENAIKIACRICTRENTSTLLRFRSLKREITTVYSVVSMFSAVFRTVALVEFVNST